MAKNVLQAIDKNIYHAQGFYSDGSDEGCTFSDVELFRSLEPPPVIIDQERVVRITCDDVTGGSSCVGNENGTINNDFIRVIYPKKRNKRKRKSNLRIHNQNALMTALDVTSSKNNVQCKGNQMNHSVTGNKNAAQAKQSVTSQNNVIGTANSVQPNNKSKQKKNKQFQHFPNVSSKKRTVPKIPSAGSTSVDLQENLIIGSNRAKKPQTTNEINEANSYMKLKINHQLSNSNTKTKYGSSYTRELENKSVQSFNNKLTIPGVKKQKTNQNQKQSNDLTQWDRLKQQKKSAEPNETNKQDCKSAVSNFRSKVEWTKLEKKKQYSSLPHNNEAAGMNKMPSVLPQGKQHNTLYTEQENKKVLFSSRDMNNYGVKSKKKNKGKIKQWNEQIKHSEIKQQEIANEIKESIKEDRKTAISSLSNGGEWKLAKTRQFSLDSFDNMSTETKELPSMLPHEKQYDSLSLELENKNVEFTSRELITDLDCTTGNLPGIKKKGKNRRRKKPWNNLTKHSEVKQQETFSEMEGTTQENRKTVVNSPNSNDDWKKVEKNKQFSSVLGENKTIEIKELRSLLPQGKQCTEFENKNVQFIDRELITHLDCTRVNLPGIKKNDETEQEKEQPNDLKKYSEVNQQVTQEKSNGTKYITKEDCNTAIGSLSSNDEWKELEKNQQFSSVPCDSEAVEKEKFSSMLPQGMHHKNSDVELENKNVQSTDQELITSKTKNSTDSLVEVKKKKKKRHFFFCCC